MRHERTGGEEDGKAPPDQQLLVSVEGWRMPSDKGSWVAGDVESIACGDAGELLPI